MTRGPGRRAPGAGCTTCAPAAPRPGPTGSGRAIRCGPLPARRPAARAAPAAQPRRTRSRPARRPGARGQRRRPRPAGPGAGRRGRGGSLRPAAGGPGRPLGRRAAAGGDRRCSPRTSPPPGLPSPRRRRRPRPWRARYRLVGDPELADRGPGRAGRARSSPGRRRTQVVVVLGTDLGRMLADAWTARCFDSGVALVARPGSAGSRATTGCPPRTDLAQVAADWARRVGPRPGARRARPSRAAGPARRTPPLTLPGPARRRRPRPGPPGRGGARPLRTRRPGARLAATPTLRPLLAGHRRSARSAYRTGTARVGDRARRAHGRGAPRRWLRCARRADGPAADERVTR